MMSTASRYVPRTQSSKSVGVSLSVTFMMLTFVTSARPDRASPPDETAPITELWLAPKLNEMISIASFLVVVGPGRPLITQYALTAIVFLLKKIHIRDPALGTTAHQFLSRLGLLHRGRQFSPQPQRNGKFIKLEVRTQESHRTIDPGLAR